MNKEIAKPKRFISKISAKGVVKIPEEILSELDIKDGESIVFLKRGSSWTITTRARQLVEGQAYFKSLNPDNISLVDELIAERRAEALKENE